MLTGPSQLQRDFSDKVYAAGKKETSSQDSGMIMSAHQIFFRERPTGVWNQKAVFVLLDVFSVSKARKTGESFKGRFSRMPEASTRADSATRPGSMTQAH